MADVNELHESPEAFLQEKGRNSVLLSGPAAVAACLAASDANLSIGRVEGGQWLDPGFMARMDSIWDSRRHALSREEARRWNISAAEFVKQQMQQSPDSALPPANAFFLTATEFKF